MSLIIRTFSIHRLAVSLTKAGHAGTRLLLLSSKWYAWCEQWKTEVRGVFPKTDGGRTMLLTGWAADIAAPEQRNRKAPAPT